MLEKLKQRLSVGSGANANGDDVPPATQAAPPTGEHSHRGQTAVQAPPDDAGMPPAPEWPVEP
jgi:hypothetical protein